MAKYQRPCCILTKVTEKDENGDTKISYQGSARGYDASGVTNFKDICEQTGCVMYVAGHQGAFGLGINWGKDNEYEGEVAGDSIISFLYATDEALKDMGEEPIYLVDYIFDYDNPISENVILDIADAGHLWGKDMNEPYVAIKMKITADDLVMMKSNTLKIKGNGCDILKFGCSDEEWEKLYSPHGCVEIEAICKCNKNEWNGNISPQLFLEDFNVISECAYVF